ncbi:MAG TPA: RebB family R body protein [Alphaproteobacteria bacterium]|nr:RebB family R body protein [Alphaproteobacteria bacterium]
MANAVEAQVTDAVAEANLATIGNGIPLSSTQSFLASTSAQGTVFASAVRQQRELAIAGLAATVKGAAQILALSRRQPERPTPRQAQIGSLEARLAELETQKAGATPTPKTPSSTWTPDQMVT